MHNMQSPLLNVLDKGWPFAASILASVFTFGTMHSQVVDLRAEQVRNNEDHAVIAALKQGQVDERRDLDDIKSTLHRIEQSR